MMIKLMYITNQPEYAKAAVAAGVDRIFVDLEHYGKEQRQSGLDTVKSKHTLDDVMAIRDVITPPAKLLVRVNPLHAGSTEEIDAVIRAGADIVMLPMWTSVQEVREFVRLVGGRARAVPLLETARAAQDEVLQQVLDLCGVDEIYIGLNDLHLSKNQPFIFCPLADGTVARLAAMLRSKGVPFGFGGIAAMDGGLLPGALILGEHVSLGSNSVILSRSFCRNDLPLDVFSSVMTTQIAALRQKEHELTQHMTGRMALKNHQLVCECVDRITAEKEKS